jgi:hypothetical protein
MAGLDPPPADPAAVDIVTEHVPGITVNNAVSGVAN